MQVNDRDRAEFATTGILNIKQRIAKGRTDPAREAILCELTRLRLGYAAYVLHCLN